MYNLRCAAEENCLARYGLLSAQSPMFLKVHLTGGRGGPHSQSIEKITDKVVFIFYF